MRAIILSIGDELILGQVTDTNAGWLSARLVEHGIVPEYHETVADDLNAIVASVRRAASGAGLVLITGGLGPTKDDLSREALARVLKVPLVLHKPSLAALREFFKKRGRVMSESNSIQAMFPRGARVLDNPVGTAPGFSARVGKATVAVMPGVPREMQFMFARHVVPMLRKKVAGAVLTARINAFGIGESVVGERLGELMRRDRNPLVGTTASGAVISIRIRGEFKDKRAGARAMRQTAAEVRRRIDNYIFSEGDDTISDAVGKLLAARRKTLATAESCTAGLLGAMITETPGSSRYYAGGWIVYSNAMKTACLGVPAALIRRHGAVSEAVAREMAEGALKKVRADYALAITGIAGPGGATPAKEVGTVWIALARGSQGRSAVASAEKFMFPGERALVRERAAKAALNMLRLHLTVKD
ncbi:MAG: competence/damage-inducible protein A [Kiritimatiellia bacterium]